MTLRSALYRSYWMARALIVPALRYSQYTYEDILKLYVRFDTRWIDIGCGRSILPSWRTEEEGQLVKKCKVIVGIDYHLDSLKDHSTITRKVRGDIARLPFVTNSFDLATANMVVEHLYEPREQFCEINRILRPEGVLLFHTPNALDYGTIMAKLTPGWLKRKLIFLLEGRREEDVFKTYYRANTERRISELARSSGFEVVRIEAVATDAVFAMIPPLFLVELIWIRLLMTKPLRSLRGNIIAVLRKSSSAKS